jgi:hypothetical protein
MNRRARALLATGGWLAAAAAATTIGVVAISAAGSGIAGSATTPLTSDQVTKALASTSEQPTPQPAASPTGKGVTRILATRGGSIIARCADGEASLLSWSPAQGYQADNIQRGPAPTTTMKFETGDTEIHVSITCPHGIPTLHTTTHTDTDD